jgi:hypothetical protein
MFQSRESAERCRVEGDSFADCGRPVAWQASMPWCPGGAGLTPLLPCGIGPQNRANSLPYICILSFNFPAKSDKCFTPSIGACPGPGLALSFTAIHTVCCIWRAFSTEPHKRYSAEVCRLYWLVHFLHIRLNLEIDFIFCKDAASLHYCQPLLWHSTFHVMLDAASTRYCNGYKIDAQLSSLEARGWAIA